MLIFPSELTSRETVGVPETGIESYHIVASFDQARGITLEETGTIAGP